MFFTQHVIFRFLAFFWVKLVAIYVPLLTSIDERTIIQGAGLRENLVPVP